MKHGVVFIVCVFLVSSCITPIEYTPNEGVWCCEELKITINCDGGFSYITIGEEEIRCSLHNDRGSQYIYIDCQEINSKNHKLNEVFLEGIVILLDEREMIIQEEGTGIIYTFTRQDRSVKGENLSKP